ncbi:MAG: hypothetical protein KME16_28375 [Scytolyngbya sp. HA4215-MV1]|jgi:hypothetical protein|nr:hypothetical protein [Scytolyngbya sp. HA4215-MV1]
MNHQRQVKWQVGNHLVGLYSLHGVVQPPGNSAPPGAVHVTCADRNGSIFVIGSQRSLEALGWKKAGAGGKR